MSRRSTLTTSISRQRSGDKLVFDPARVQVGAQPIIWSNDDFHELGGKTSLDQCLSEMRESGYAGTELGHKFPTQPDLLKRVLEKHSLQLISGWHSAYLASRDFESEKKNFLNHLNLLRALESRVAIIAECTERTYNRPEVSMGRGSCSNTLDKDGWKKMFRGLETFGKMAQDRGGMRLTYHPHMGTVVEGTAEIDRLLDATQSVHLAADTGHLTFAGIEVSNAFRRYRSRIAHVHLKNVRPHVVEEAITQKLSFREAVKRGAFTVPGDGGIDFEPLFRVLADANYAGWLVVEAEQDPLKAPPLEYARRAREYVRKTTGL